MSKMSDKKYMSIKEAAKYFSISESFIYKNWERWEDNKIKCLKFGKAIRINIEQLEKYLAV